MSEEFESLWQESDDTVDDETRIGGLEEPKPVGESIKLIFIEIPVSALRG